MRLAANNHYNPCFWTALWNEEYYASFLAGQEQKHRGRDQVVVSLNVHSGRIYETSVEGVHVDKGMGVSQLTPDYIKAFTSRWFPDEHERIERCVDEHPDTLFVDFEDVLKGIESRGLYDSLLEAARMQDISSTTHKGNITGLLILHATRSHEMTCVGLKAMQGAGLGRFDYYWMLKSMWEDPFALARAGQPLAGAQWVLHRTPEHMFPLCDSPVMIERDRVTAVLSPRLLLRINLRVRKPESHWLTVDGISSRRLREFRRLAIQNTHREIIFSDREVLNQWAQSKQFYDRRALLRDAISRDIELQKSVAGILWALDGFGRVGPDFEKWVAPHLDI